MARWIEVCVSVSGPGLLPCLLAGNPQAAHKLLLTACGCRWLEQTRLCVEEFNAALHDEANWDGGMAEALQDGRDFLKLVSAKQGRPTVVLLPEGCVCSCWWQTPARGLQPT